MDTTLLTSRERTDVRPPRRAALIIPHEAPSNSSLGEHHLHTILWSPPVIGLLSGPWCVLYGASIKPGVATFLTTVIQASPETVPAHIVRLGLSNKPAVGVVVVDTDKLGSHGLALSVGISPFLRWDQRRLHIHGQVVNGAKEAIADVVGVFQPASWTCSGG